MKTQFVQAGACVVPDERTEEESSITIINVTKCVLEASDCSAEKNEIFQSSRTLLKSISSNSNSNNNNDDVRMSKSCLMYEVTEQINVGRCTAEVDLKTCTSTKSGCVMKDKFVEHDSTCSLDDDSSDKDQTTIYPSCVYYDVIKSDDYYYDELYDDQQKEIKGEKICRWSLEDCDVKKEGVIGFPVTYSSECTCENVKTGACFDNGTQEYFCAVSELGCDDDTEFLSAGFLMENNQHIHIECNLCRPFKEVPTVIPPISISSSFDNADETIAQTSEEVIKSDDFIPMMTIIYISASVLAVFLFIGACVYVSKKKKDTNINEDEDAIVATDNNIISDTEIL